jgi:hypothetical protein
LQIYEEREEGRRNKVLTRTVSSGSETRRVLEFGRIFLRRRFLMIAQEVHARVADLARQRKSLLFMLLGGNSAQCPYEDAVHVFAVAGGDNSVRHI